MAPTLYYAKASPPSRCVLMVAKAIGLELEHKLVNLMAGEHMKEPFLSFNPQHTVPTIVDDDFILWDSHAISTYIIQKFAKNDELYPNDLKIRSKIDQRLHFEGSVLFTSSVQYMHAVLGRSGTVEETKEKLDKALGFLEIFLVDEYIVGNSMTVADLSLIANLATINALSPISSKKFPKLVAYIEKLTKLPYFEEVNREGIDSLMAFIKSQKK